MEKWKEEIFKEIININVPGLINDRILSERKTLRGPNRKRKEKNPHILL